MKNSNTTYSASELEALEARFALRATACLSEQVHTGPHDVTERLRFARMQALERARAARGAVEMQGAGPGLLALVAGSGWWLKLGSVLPLVALIGGLLLIQHRHADAQIAAAAEIDAALLADDLPPAAYSDPGFVEFLKTPHD